MYDIGTEAGNIFDYVPQAGKGPVHIGIQKERDARGTVNFRPVGLSVR